MGEGLNKPLFFPKMSTGILYFSFSGTMLANVFEKNKKKNITTSVYRL